MNRFREYFAGRGQVRPGSVLATIVAILACQMAETEDGQANNMRPVEMPSVRQLATLDKDAFKSQPQVIEMPARRQGESICYAPDGCSLFLTSEKLPTPLWKIERTPRQ